MSSGLVRRLLACVAVAGVALAFPAAAGATISGGCTGEGHATSGGVDLTTATEWHIQSTDVGGGSGTAPAPIRAASVSAYAAGISIPIASGTDEDGETSGSVEGVSASLFAMLGARFTIAGSASGDASCSGQITIIIDDVNPLLTALGGGGLLVAVLGALVVLASMRGSAGVGKRLVSAFFGLLGGLGAVLALEQFGVLDPTQILGLLIVLAAAIVGFMTAGMLGSRGEAGAATAQ